MKKAAFVFLVFPFLFQPGPVCAGLGESQDSVGKDQAKFLFQDRAAESHELFTVHVISKPGLTIREYADLGGKIFAIAWNGRAHPDLSSLLGPFADEFRKANVAQSAHPSSRRFGSVHGPNLTVEKAGIMRSSRGRAYVLSLFPAGVDLKEIK